MPYLPATPGERIGDLRTARHMTRKELAARIGVDPICINLGCILAVFTKKRRICDDVSRFHNLIFK